MQRSMTCEQAYDEIYQYLDRELSNAEISVVRLHLENCPPCAYLFRFEGTVVRYVRERSAQETCPAAVVKTIIMGFRARVSARFSC
ncbi:MAG: zf-HC2 domain-containing protein [Chloroflexota bacterium]